MSNQKSSNITDLIYGKDPTQGITSITVKDGLVKQYKADGSMLGAKHQYYMLWSRKLSDNHHELEGDQFYRYFTKRETEKEHKEDKNWARKYKHDAYVIHNTVEQYMVKNGITYFKGMQFDDLSVMSFDIETTGLKHNDQSKTLLISTTYKNKGRITRKLFSIEQFNNDREMIKSFCDYVVKMDPHVMTGHNIIMYDIPYMTFCYGKPLPLGKAGRPMISDKYEREFRKDGSQTYSYTNVNIDGREIVDTWFLAIKYDVGRKYPNYSLKGIIEFEGLQRKDRVFYDASQIRKNYTIPAEWEKIKAYAEHDADDSLNLFNLMCPAYFYYTQSISKSFQEVILGATGSQINNMMVRSYLQQGKSIPKASHVSGYQGGTSFGNSGIYDDVLKVDVASMYPSIILDKELYDTDKDPDSHVFEITKYFTQERLANKLKFKTTKERKFDDLQSAQKIVINSIYGFLGCGGLQFNSPEIASTITREARAHLQAGINWAEDKGYTIVNADTDSFMYQPNKRISEAEFKDQIKELNSLFSKNIVWEDDGQYKRVIIVKAKNYCMVDYSGNVTTKGSGLKGTMKEPALKRYMKEVLDALMSGREDTLPELYAAYAARIKRIEDIKEWASKKTVTKAVLEAKRTTELRIKEACQDGLDSGRLNEGDKINVFFKTKTELATVENFDGTYDLDTLLGKLFDTTKIFGSIVDIKRFPNYKLKKNKPLLELICGASS